MAKGIASVFINFNVRCKLCCIFCIVKKNLTLRLCYSLRGVGRDGHR
jgi:hypothetical protein